MKKIPRPKKRIYWNNKPFNLKKIETWNKYPVRISNKLVKMIIDKSGKILNPEHVRYIMGIYFTEMAQYLSEQRRGAMWYIDDLGSFKTKTYDKIVKSHLNGEKKTIIKYDLKKVRFAFYPKFKRRAYKTLNRGNQAVYDYMEEKRKHRRVARRIFGIKRVRVNNVSERQK